MLNTSENSLDVIVVFSGSATTAFSFTLDGLGPKQPETIPAAAASKMTPLTQPPPPPPPWFVIAAMMIFPWDC